MEKFLQEMKNRAGLSEDPSDDMQYELHIYNRGNSRPFVSEGDSYQIAEEVQEILSKNGDAAVVKLTIVPMVHGTDTLRNR